MSFEMPIVCATWHTDKATASKFCIHKARKKQGTETFSMMNLPFHSVLALQSIKAPTVMKPSVHLELFIWVTR